MGESVTGFGPLSLAYLGDAVYERYVREYLLKSRGNLPVEKYHRLATAFVRAEAQAEASEQLRESFDEEENDIFRKARNARSHAAPKGVATGIYHRATGFEAVIGWLYLSGKEERAQELMAKTIAYLEEKQ
ncbi:MAG: ribonuclease III [Lachnospiraceae bacterium]|nr:ribonuclease III [Lachnospiraceae bacterium]